MSEPIACASGPENGGSHAPRTDADFHQAHMAQAAAGFPIFKTTNDKRSLVDEDTLLWLDLETTGSDVEHDCIIEMGCILTTTDLIPLGEFSKVLTPEPVGYGRMMLNPTVRAMHEANGLLAEIMAAEHVVKPHHGSEALLGWMTSLGAREGRTVLAGSGVGHFDRKFIDRYMPQVSRFLRYGCIDVGVIRRAHEMWAGTVVSTANDGKTHRALDDIRCHLAEAQAYRSLWNVDV
jgi:oligoribonuclease